MVLRRKMLDVAFTDTRYILTLKIQGCPFHGLKLQGYILMFVKLYR